MRPGWFKGSAPKRTYVRINKPGQGEAVMSTQDGRAGSPDTRDTNLTRRALIRAGWIIPAVLVVSLPSKAFAEYGGVAGPSIRRGAHFSCHGTCGRGSLFRRRGGG